MNAQNDRTATSPLRHAFDKSSSWVDNTTRQDVASEDTGQAAPRHSLCCVNCRTPITTPAAALEINGRHLHVCTNPQGDTFEIRLFATANCSRQGPATTDYTWFTGHAWQLALCSNCRLQLGWVYSKIGAAGFYGLIDARLTYSDS